MAKLDLKSLFERKRYGERPEVGYKTMKAELDAVHAGKKAVSYGSVNSRWIESQDFLDLQREALRRDLMLVLDPDRDPTSDLPEDLQHVRYYVLRYEEMWRIPAMRALWDTAYEDGSWSFAAEAQMSLLLGYSAKQREAWMENDHWASVSSGSSRTYYTLLTKVQRDEIANLGQKAFREPGGVTIFESAGLPMKRKAATMVPKGITIARFALHWQFGSEILHKRRRYRRPLQVISGVVPERLAVRFNAELRSKIEFLGRRGWS